jgi:hypothetical protein
VYILSIALSPPLGLFCAAIFSLFIIKEAGGATTSLYPPGRYQRQRVILRENRVFRYFSLIPCILFTLKVYAFYQNFIIKNLVKLKKNRGE